MSHNPPRTLQRRDPLFPEDLAAALARRQAIIPMNSLTIVELARAARPSRPVAQPDTPPIVYFAIVALALLASWGILSFSSWVLR